MPGIVTLDYVVKMALDSSLTRGELSGAQQPGEHADELGRRHASPIRPTSSGISVRLWDEVPPELPFEPPLEDDSSEG